MSILRTNQIQTVGGKPIVNSTGSVLQVVNSNTVGSSSFASTTSASYVSTGFSVSISPQSSTSKLFVICTFNGKFISGAGDDGAAFRIYRDGTAINTNSGDQLIYRADANLNNHHQALCITHYVNANSTNSTTFALYFADFWGGEAHYSQAWGTNNFTVMEISG